MQRNWIHATFGPGMDVEVILQMAWFLMMWHKELRN